MHKALTGFLILFFLFSLYEQAETTEPDPPEILLFSLDFENSLLTSDGESPMAANGYSFEPSIDGTGIYLEDGGRLRYDSAGNINLQAGMIEFWVQKKWDEPTPEQYFFQTVAFRFYKDGARSLRFITWDNDRHERGIECGAGHWLPDEWHHIQGYWGDFGLRLYVDGLLVSSRDDFVPRSTTDFLDICRSGESITADCVIDNLKIWAYTAFTPTPMLTATPTPSPTQSPIPSQPQLSFVTSTRTQIVLKWTGQFDARLAGYHLQRSESPNFADAVLLNLSPKSNIYSDTGKSPSDAMRLVSTELEFGKEYYYRIRAAFDGNHSLWSNTVTGRLQNPVRGQEGDLFADVVLGQRNFFENTLGKTLPNDLGYCGGMLIDTSSSPQRALFVDQINNRILGFSSIDQKSFEPDIIIGQPDYLSSAANGDSTMNSYPDIAKPSAGTLAFMRANQIPIIECILISQMAIDASGSLFVADANNNRVLRYNDPFIEDSTADEVWGQPDFTSNKPNNGGRSKHSLSVNSGHTAFGVVLDATGSLWVSDTGNCRILRFPKDPLTGIISKEADLVLGQKDFKSIIAKWYGNSMVFLGEDLYVAQIVYNVTCPYRIAVYSPPFKNGMQPTRLLSQYPDTDQPAYLYPDPLGRGLWVRNVAENWNSHIDLLNVSDGQASVSLHGKFSCRGLALDSLGRLYVHARGEGVYRYYPPYNDKTKEKIFSDEPNMTGRDFWKVKGVSLFGEQLVIVDDERVLVWNDVSDATDYGHPNDLWGQDSYEVCGRTIFGAKAFPNVDGKNRLWMFSFHEETITHISLESPISHESPISRVLHGPFELLDGSHSVSLALPTGWRDFAPSKSGDEMWIPDAENSRVIRVNNIDGENDPTRGPYVDVILGQYDCISGEVNQGGDMDANTFARPIWAKLDANENLYVSDNSGEGGTNQRLLVFDHSLFPDHLEKVLYAVPATAVLGSNNCLTCRGCGDEVCGPLQCGFGPKGELVLGMEAYNAHRQRFPLVFMNPSRYLHPQFALGDYCGSATYSHVDSDGNVYIGDSAWSRVLIYKKPFKDFYEETEDVSVPPIVDIEGTNLSGPAPLVVDVTASGTDPDGVIDRYRWVTDMNIFTDIEIATSASMNVSRQETFTEGGDHSITLQSWDDDNQLASARLNIAVWTEIPTQTPTPTITRTPDPNATLTPTPTPTRTPITPNLTPTPLPVMTTPPLLVFSLDFENTLLTSDGEAPISSGKVVFSPSTDGQGASLEQDGHLHYISEGNINVSAGMIEMSVQRKWGDTSPTAIFFMTDRLLLSKDGGQALRFILWDDDHTEYSTDYSVRSWLPDSWHHIQAYWGEFGVFLFADGELVSFNPDFRPCSSMDYLSFLRTNPDKNADAVIDAVRIWAYQMAATPSFTPEPPATDTPTDTATSPPTDTPTDTPTPLPTFRHLLFSLDFENSLLTSDGEAPISSDKVVFPTSNDGLGVSLEEDGHLHYNTEGNINVSSGMIEMWVQRKWEDAAPNVRFLMTDRLLLSKDNNQYLRFIMWDDESAEYSTNYSVRSWLPDSWHHIQAYWGTSGIYLFTDGKLVCVNANFKPCSSMEPLNFLLTNPGDTVIDAVRIWSNERPTPAVPYTDTPTLSPTRTPTPTSTLTASSTPTASDTPTPFGTPTPTRPNAPYLLFSLDFEDNVRSSDGENPTKQQGVDYLPGVQGWGLHLQNGGSLQYASSGNIDSNGGLVEFWVQKRWTDASFSYIFFSSGSFTILKDTSDQIRFVLRDPNMQLHSVSLSADSWLLESWHKIQAYWGTFGLILIVDGETVSKKAALTPASVGDTLEICRTFLQSYVDASVIDQLRIYAFAPPAPTATPTALPTDTPTVSPTDTPTITPSETPTLTPSCTPTATLTPTIVPTSPPTATLTSTPTVPAYSADLNGDGVVDRKDLLILLSADDSMSYQSKFDPNLSGSIDSMDVFLLMLQWQPH